MPADDATAQLQIYRQLHKLARYHLRFEHQTVISPTSLVHEAWIKLSNSKSQPGDKLQDTFMCHAGRAMRQILVDHARRRNADKRIPAGSLTIVSDVMLAAEPGMSLGLLLQLDAALHKLQAIDADMVKVVELRYFAGFSLAETAASMHCSERQVSRLWTAARAWLLNEMR